jgi:hypothetical protein
MAAMPSRLGGRGYQVREETSAYDGNSIDLDPDSDLDETQQGGNNSRLDNTKKENANGLAIFDWCVLGSRGSLRLRRHIAAT